MEIAGNAALVTGGASGLGAATARKLTDRGMQVCVLDLPSAIGAAEHLDGVRYVCADITDPVQVQPAVDEAADGEAPLRVVVNCAGIGPSMRILSKRGPHDLALYAKVIQINLIGTFNVMTLASARIAETQPLADGARGVVINTASIAAFDGQVGQAAYASSKGGVVGLTLPAARDLAQYGIRVLTICPGVIETPMLATVAEDVRSALAAGVPFPPRLGLPDEYATLALNLIEHDYMNGETIRMDGALRMAPR